MTAAGMEERLRALEDERAIRDVLDRYGHDIDYGFEDDWLDCFTAGGSWESVRRDGQVVRCAGRAELAAFAARHTRAPESFHKHVVANIRVHVTGDDATASSYFLRVDAGPPGTPAYVWAMGRYLDRFERSSTDGRWRIAQRRAEIEDQFAVSPGVAARGRPHMSLLPACPGGGLDSSPGAP